MGPRINLRLDCECPELCDHAIEKISEIVQEAFDYGFDEGWSESFRGLRDMFIERGLPGAEELTIPEPPARHAKRAIVMSRPPENKKEYTN